MSVSRAAIGFCALLLAACGSAPPRGGRETPAAAAKPSLAPPGAVLPAPSFQAPTQRGGGYYQDDGPGENPPPDLAAIPDAVPQPEPPHRFANRPYSVLGRSYVPLARPDGYRARGIASWYGKKFHGQKTSSGEAYDMYAMSAAHPTLTIPSYVRVRNPANGRSVVVRVNDRGPFHADRLIDLSYTAAWKLGYIGQGSTAVEVEAIAAGSPPAADDPLGRLALAAAARTVLDAEAAPLPTRREAGGTWLQLGAFGNRDNAEAFLTRMARELGGELAAQLALSSDGRLHRIRLGPYASADAAQQAAAQLQSLLGTAPLPVRQ